MDADETILAELVSYLDGELPEDERERVERRMADDEAYRNQLLKLQKSWEMLDHLPRAPITEGFACSTVEMVALAASRELAESRLKTPLRKGRWIPYIAAAIVLVGFVAGFAIVRSSHRKASRQLVRDLPVIENVDVYGYVESVDFLSDLEASGLFSGEAVDDST